MDAAEAVLARALRALEGTAAEVEGAAAAARVRKVVEKVHADAAAKARAEAIVPATKAAEEARAKASKGDAEGALADLLGVLKATSDPAARRTVEREVAVLRRRVAVQKDRAGRRRSADQAIEKGEYDKAREILKGLLDGAEGAGADAAEVAKDRSKLDGVKELEENREPEALAACRRALRWLVKQQLSDGSFSMPVVGDDGKKPTEEQRKKARNRMGLTGLAAMALLGHVRYDLTDEFEPALDRALASLLAAQRKDGAFSDNLYEHSICTLVLVDADRLLHRGSVKPSGTAALAWLQRAQNADGGWRYTPRSPQSDVSVTGWALQALLHGEKGDYEVRQAEEDAAREKGETPRPRLQPSIEMAFAYLDRMTDPVTWKVGYTMPGQGSDTMTAAALFCRLRYGQGIDDDRVLRAADLVVRNPVGPTWKESAYGLFYASDAMSRLGGDYWKKWAPALKKHLLGTQIKEGDAAGAWPSAGDRWGRDAGAIFVVSLNAVSLENFFEHRE